MLRTLSNIVDILTMAVSALGSISLLVGGVGIVTIMTIAVTERTGEIGLLVALGAPRNTILGLFLGEAVALSALGGLLGLLLGIGQEKARRRACADPDEAALSFGRGQPVLADHAGIPRKVLRVIGHHRDLERDCVGGDQLVEVILLAVTGCQPDRAVGKAGFGIEGNDRDVFNQVGQMDALLLRVGRHGNAIFWVPDTRSAGFAQECSRQSAPLKHDPQEKNILEFLDEAASRDGWSA